jgi:TonB family protein
MKNIISVALWLSLVLSMGAGCKNKKPNSSVESNTVEAPPPPTVENNSLDNNISLVDADSITKSKNKESQNTVKTDKTAIAEKAKKAEAKPPKIDKGKTAATTKIPAKKATAPTKVPAKGVKPTTKADNFPDEQVVKRNGRDDVLKIAEAAPVYNGGDKAMRKFLQSNIKYPSKAKDDGVQGTVFVRFVVEKNGVVDDVVVSKGVHPLLDAEAKRVVSVMPKWTPGKQKGKPVAVQYTLPVRFQIVD